MSSSKIIAGLVGAVTSIWLTRHFITSHYPSSATGFGSYNLKPSESHGGLLSLSHHSTLSHPSIGINLVSRAEEDFDWYSLQPSENLTWTDCYNGQKCARLSLPLDYATPEGPKTHIALQMIPATDTENYKGSILLNPGGPGGAGTTMVQGLGAQISQTVGPEFDIIGFDPRGTGATTPQAQCFDSESQFLPWATEGATILINASDSTLPLSRSRERLVGERCLERIGGNGREDLNGTAEEWGPGRFMSSASVATDMLRIVEQLGQDKLQYWGISYGTILGQYFAAMYPDRVGRIVIDGVCDAERYAKGLWDENLADMDEVQGSFYTFCHQAGPEKCPLYESTPEGVKQRVDRILSSVEASPLPVPFPTPALVTRGLLQFLFHDAATAPLASFESVAAQFYAVETNNQTTLQAFLSAPTTGTSNCSQTPEVQPWQASTQAFRAIAYSDSGPFEEQPGDAEKLLSHLYNDSPISAPFWASISIQGWEWKIQAKWRYPGPFSGNTSHPMLIVQPTYDSRCPMEHARRVRKRYPGTGFLEQNMYGHCALFAPSACTAKHIREYFVNGTLPEEGAKCDPDALPFIGVVGSENAQ